MTPHEKAIEAMAKAVDPAGTLGLTWEECIARAEHQVAAYLTSAIKSGWELKPRDFPYEPIPGAPEHNEQQSRAQLIWRNMFDAAPRFEDAP